MKINFLNLLLIGSIVASVMLSSYKNNDDDNNSSGGGTNPPTTGETGTFTDSRDSKTYKWVKIGEQVWMAENLAYTGNDIQHITDNNEWKNNSDYDGWCYYKNNETYGKTYGVLYQWEAAKTACPSGWHLPSDAEWTTLINYLGGEKEAGEKLKSSTGWDLYRGKNYGNNMSGFNALPAGSYITFGGGSFLSMGKATSFWSSTPDGSDNAWERFLFYNYGGVDRDSRNRSIGYSVRCLRD